MGDTLAKLKVILVAVFGSIYAGKLLYKKELQVD